MLRCPCVYLYIYIQVMCTQMCENDIILCNRQLPQRRDFLEALSFPPNTENPVIHLSIDCFQLAPSRKRRTHVDWRQNRLSPATKLLDMLEGPFKSCSDLQRGCMRGNMDDSIKRLLGSSLARLGEALGLARYSLCRTTFLFDRYLDVVPKTLCVLADQNQLLVFFAKA